MPNKLNNPGSLNIRTAAREYFRRNNFGTHAGFIEYMSDLGQTLNYRQADSAFRYLINQEFLRKIFGRDGNGRIFALKDYNNFNGKARRRRYDLLRAVGARYEARKTSASTQDTDEGPDDDSVNRENDQPPSADEDYSLSYRDVLKRLDQE